ncbi:CAF17-like 4Fe-4S cluster assembly/insertion protein YgfZ [Neoroseomonas oryzicola]|uniref:Folate-binding protein YgfZ n=1 Tax=Neoroseomonas oryzicola TaxID=535904 RepID=A0A9X9WE10_9PROT|nr:folate-binding protein YgfZ [Neoroseomonas oryzicola]MBR0658570.1 folate-binding protein YgfZ [Neoroseomonas oryzicola]NKE16601.1 folate-binding protein YgfZ [Neoroseomonas oryzicola]
MSVAILPDRGVLEVAGPDRAAFLQGLVSNDVTHLAPGQVAWSALLTPQGKWLADFFVVATEDAFLLDAERAQVADLATRLGRFRLRSKVTLRDASEDWHVHAAWGTAPAAGDVVVPDPRLPEAGWRVLSRAPLATDATAEDYDRHRLALGLPDGSRDMEREKSVLLEAGFDELHGVSWSKGCYMGQELTARTRYRGLIKRRLVPVAVEGPLPPRGTIVTDPAGAEVGEMRSGRDGTGIALLRIDALDRAPFTAGEARLVPRIAAWMRLPAREEA